MAYNFNGINQYMSCPAPMTGQPMTMAAWMTWSGGSGTNRRPLTLGDTTGSHRRGFLLGTTNNFALADAGATATVSSGNAGFPAQNVWFHGAGVFNSATSRTAYFNGGNPTTSTANRGTQVAPNELTLWAGYMTGVLGGYTSGLIAEVGIWNAALTAAEIASLAKGMTCDKVRPQNLVFYAPLIRDLSDNKGGLTITNNNGAVVANHPKIYA
jgi:hypothetical protein